MLSRHLVAAAAAPALLLSARRRLQCDSAPQPGASPPQVAATAPSHGRPPASGARRRQKSVDEVLCSPAPRWKRAWDDDWDGRHPPPGSGVECGGKIRHLLLVRHGQYDLEDPAHGLTPLGQQQAALTGQRLAAQSAGVKKDAYGEQRIRYSLLVSSDVLRARQTADAIAAELPTVPRASDDTLLAEGFPVLPMPQGPAFLRDGKVTPSSIIEEGPKIEAGFRRYFRRDVDHKRAAPADAGGLNEAFVPRAAPGANAISPEAAAAAAMEHEYIVLVCHMNVIRYFVARALQLPPEMWLRMRGNNCGITEVIIQPNGYVSLGSFADVGHLTIEQVTFH